MRVVTTVRREPVAVLAAADGQVQGGTGKRKAAALPLGKAAWRMVLIVAFGVLLAVTAGEAIVSAIVPNIGDHITYFGAAQRWLASGSFYPAYQLTGPYLVVGTEILYPPTILPLLVVFSFLPAVLWWVVPIAILAGVLLYWRPSLAGWTLILACLANPLSLTIYLWGNPGMWIVAFVALGTVYGWPAVFVLLKPTLAPFALVGIRRRSWWVALGVLAVVSLAFLPLWGQYVTVLLNARGPLVSPLYSLPSVPLMLVPLVARWASTRRTRRPSWVEERPWR